MIILIININNNKGKWLEEQTTRHSSDKFVSRVVTEIVTCGKYVKKDYWCVEVIVVIFMVIIIIIIIIIS